MRWELRRIYLVFCWRFFYLLVVWIVINIVLLTLLIESIVLHVILRKALIIILHFFNLIVSVVLVIIPLIVYRRVTASQICPWITKIARTLNILQSLISHSQGLSQVFVSQYLRNYLLPLIDGARKMVCMVPSGRRILHRFRCNCWLH